MSEIINNIQPQFKKIDEQIQQQEKEQIQQQEKERKEQAALKKDVERKLYDQGMDNRFKLLSEEPLTLISKYYRNSDQPFLATWKSIIEDMKDLYVEQTEKTPKEKTVLESFITDLKNILNTGLSERTKTIVKDGIQRLKTAMSQCKIQNPRLNELKVILEKKLEHLENETNHFIENTANIQVTKNNPTNNIPAYELLARAKSYDEFDNFFKEINISVPEECSIKNNIRLFENNLDNIWPCKMKYIGSLVKQYNQGLYQDFEKLDNIALKFALFMRNKDKQTYNKKEKIEELKSLIKSLKKSFFSKIKSVFKSKEEDEKKVEKVVDALKKALIADIEKYAK